MSRHWTAPGRRQGPKPRGIEMTPAPPASPAPGLRARELRPQFEVIPLPGIVEQVAGHLPPGARVTVTASARQGLFATIATARALAQRGFTAIPHLAARQVRGAGELSEILAELARGQVREVFVIAGDAPRPAGDFSGALDLLSALAAAEPGITLGAGVHPEGHPFLDAEAAMALLHAKAELASYLVTQLFFEAPALLEWVRRIRAEGIRLPVRPGIAAPTGTARLLRIGTRIGVGRSLRMLRGESSGIRRLLAPGRWSPDALLRELAPAYAAPELRLAGPHVYTFNALQDAAAVSAPSG